jgi:hypothetical protein
VAEVAVVRFVWVSKVAPRYRLRAGTGFPPCPSQLAVSTSPAVTLPEEGSRLNTGALAGSEQFQRIKPKLSVTDNPLYTKFATNEDLKSLMIFMKGIAVIEKFRG